LTSEKCAQDKLTLFPNGSIFAEIVNFGAFTFVLNGSRTNKQLS